MGVFKRNDGRWIVQYCLEGHYSKKQEYFGRGNMARNDARKRNTQILRQNAAYRANDEKKLNRKLCKMLQERHGAENVRTEVQTKHGVIDILTPEEVIEIKRAVDWKNAIGQVSVYSVCFPKKKKVICLFGIVPDKKKAHIYEACDFLNIDVSFYSLGFY